MRKIQKITLIIFAAILVFALLLAVFFLLGKGGKSEDQSSVAPNTIVSAEVVYTSSVVPENEKKPGNHSAQSRYTSSVVTTSGSKIVTSDSKPALKSEASSQSAEQKCGPASQITKVYAASSKNHFELPEMQYKTFYDDASGKTLPYRIYIPDNYSSSQKYPVLFWLHGAGERGNNNNTHIQPLAKSFQVAGDLLSGAIILAPQCPSDGWWNIDDYDGYEMGWLGVAMRLLYQVKSEYSCDSNRIYVSGLSMGGYGTWSVLERYGNVFAAGVPICGWGDSSQGVQLAKVPIWIYHGDADDTVSYYASLEMYNAIIMAGGNMVHFITLNGVGHNAWDYALADRELFCWMFAQNRDKSKNSDDSYEYISVLEVVSSQNETVFTDMDIDYYSSYYEADKVYMTVYLSSDAAERLKKAYNSNKGQEFTAYYYSERLYTFILLSAPEDNVFVLGDCVTQEMIQAIPNIIKKY